jgi:hypothetical protein
MNCNDSAYNTEKPGAQGVIASSEATPGLDPGKQSPSNEAPVI